MSTEAELQLYFVACRNDIDAFNTMLDDHPDTTAGGYQYQILIMAAHRGFTPIVERILLDDRVDPGLENNAALSCAVMRGHMDVVQCLFDDVRVDPSADENHAYIVARASGYNQIAALLLTDPRVEDGLPAIQHILNGIVEH